MSEVGELLKYHWAMDDEAAECLSVQISNQEVDMIAGHVSGISKEALLERDRGRELMKSIITGKSDKLLVVAGSCSEDEELDQGAVNAVIKDTAEQSRDRIYAVSRINGAKPRSGGRSVDSGGDWTGSINSTKTKDRKRLIDKFSMSIEDGVGCLTEITSPTQIGTLAPFLTGYWLGNRDVGSTLLRTMASAIHLAAWLKNDNDPSGESTKRAIENIARSSWDNGGSGIDFGTVAGGPGVRGVPTGVLPIGLGNSYTGIVARGYLLRRNGAIADDLEEVGINHLSALNKIAVTMGKVAILDGSHDVPKMFNINGSDSDRFKKVMSKVISLVKAGRIEYPEVMRGVMVEMGTELGRTDPNWIITESTAVELSELIIGLDDAISRINIA